MDRLQPDSRDRPEIEVTSDMEKAGALELSERRLGDDLLQVARHVYYAMENVRLGALG